MEKFEQLAGMGQAIWLDFISKSLVSSGELKELVKSGLRGVTSNPSIFNQAIAGSTDYDRDMRDLVEDGASVPEIYESLTLEDIRQGYEFRRAPFVRIRDPILLQPFDLERTEIPKQFGRLLVAFSRIFRQHLVHGATQSARQIGPHILQPRGRFLEVLHGDAQRRIAFERRPAC